MVALSAVFSGVADLKKAFEQARARRATGQSTLLFVDEIHRFNRAQQDGFLPLVEDGMVTLVGATTENPSFELNGALALALPGVGAEPPRRRGARGADRARRGDARPRAAARPRRARGSVALADGDGRYLLNMVESLFDLPAEPMLDRPRLRTLLQRRSRSTTSQQEAHYNLISALHKSVRGSDPDAALYWLARMLNGGEDPLYVARRLVRMAIEDIGLADPSALPLAIAPEAYDYLGSPGGRARAGPVRRPSRARAQVERGLPGLRRGDGRGQGDRLADAARAHPERADAADEGAGLRQGLRLRPRRPEGFSGQDYFPDGMERQAFYRPTGEGAEAALRKRLERFARLTRQRTGEK